jgi:hydroxyethylthiazole kinase-like uncharacterized protein yjeF
VLLAGLAALRVGAGRLQLATVPDTAVALGVAVPECKSLGVPAAQLGQVPLDGVDAVLVGPGFLDPDLAARILQDLLPRLDGRPVVVDALALAGLGGRLDGVITPNPSELRRLAGADDDLDVLAAKVAAQHGVTVTTQDWVAAPDGRTWRSDVGDVGLATSGSGDVLAGLVLGLLGRGADPVQAACWAHWLHGAAGEVLAREVGRTQYLARELLDAVPRALRDLGD